MYIAPITVAPRFSSIVAGILAAEVTLSLFVMPVTFPQWHGQSFIERALDTCLTEGDKRFLKRSVGQLAVAIPGSIDHLEHLSWKRRCQGRYAESTKFQEDALKVTQAVYGARSKQWVCSMFDLAWCYEEQGRYQLAEQTFKKALQISETVLGEQHQCTDRLNLALGYLYERQGRFAECEHFFLKRLKFFADSPGCKSNLARMYMRAKNFSEAERICKKLASTFESLYVDTDIAMLYQRNTQYTQAESMMLEQIRKHQAGSFFSPFERAKLACLYEEMGRFKSAERVLESAISELKPEPLLEGQNKDSRHSFNWMHCELADVYKREGRFHDAEQLYTDILKEKQQRLGEDHVYTAIHIDDLGRLFESQGRFAEAESSYRKALQIRLMSLNKEHPDVGLSYRNLSAICKLQGRAEESAALYKESLNSFMQVLTLQERRIESDPQCACNTDRNRVQSNLSAE